MFTPLIDEQRIEKLAAGFLPILGKYLAGDMTDEAFGEKMRRQLTLLEKAQATRFQERTKPKER